MAAGDRALDCRSSRRSIVVFTGQARVHSATTDLHEGFLPRTTPLTRPMALAHLYDRAQRTIANGKRVWVACVEGDYHDFPARPVADSLDLAGFDVRYLGANVPMASLIQMLEREWADPLAPSVTLAFNLPALHAAVVRVRTAFGGKIPVAVGGAYESMRNALESAKADIGASDARALIACAPRQLGLNPA